MHSHFELVKFAMNAVHFALKTAMARRIVSKFIVDLIDIARNTYEIAPDVGVRPIVAQLPSHVPAHAIEIIDFRLQ